MAQEETNNSSNLLTLKQASQLLSCHPNTLRKWDNSGYLKAIRIGKRGDRRYKKAEVMKLLEGKIND
ncbi:MAG TPA: helix-turn-helix domain-containing protein [Candidatus Saccharimonadales bacterium]|nr:helix-turn-helix domain-containing protein [Candidatus Saccharimonadales bacterium]